MESSGNLFDVLLALNGKKKYFRALLARPLLLLFLHLQPLHYKPSFSILYPSLFQAFDDISLYTYLSPLPVGSSTLIEDQKHSTHATVYFDPPLSPHAAGTVHT